MATSTYEVRITGDAKSLERTLGKVDRSLTGSAKNWAKFAAQGAAIAAVGAGVTKVATATVDFDRSMRNVNSIAQLNEKQFRKLEDSVLSLAGPTAQAPKALAEGLYDLVSSGFESKDALDVLEASAKAATAGLTTTDVATKAVAATLNAYKLPAKQAGRVSDALFRTVDRGVVSFEELSNTIGDALPFASSLGVSIEEVGAATATMTKAGISAPETMTRIKNVMVTMLKPGDDLKQAFKDLGVESGESLIKQKGLQGALEALVGTTDGTKSSVAKLFPEIRAMGGVLALTGKNAKGAGEDLKGMRESAGATERALSQQTKSMGYWMDWLGAKTDEMAIRAGKALQRLVEDVSKGKGEIGRLIKDAMPTIRALGTVWREVVLPMVKGAISGIMNQIKGFIGFTSGAVKVVSALLRGDFKEAWAGVKQIFKSGVDFAVGLVKGATAPMRLAAGLVDKALTGVFGGTWDRIKGIFESGANAVIGVLNSMIDILQGIPFIGDKISNIATLGGGNSGRDVNGKSLGRQRGGPINLGAPSGDTVPAMLERGEYVLNRNAVKAVGARTLDAINYGMAPRFQKGGPVQYLSVGSIIKDVAGYTPPGLAFKGAKAVWSKGFPAVANAVSGLSGMGDQFPSWVDGSWFVDSAIDWLKGNTQAQAKKIRASRSNFTGGSGRYPGVSGDTDFLPALGMALSRMARAAGTNISVASGWRSREEQAALYEAYLNGTGNLAAPPGSSNHEDGRAADISPGRELFGAMAGKFGLGFTVPSESWHIELLRRGGFVGLQRGGGVGDSVGKRITELLIQSGISKEAAAGIAGNAYGESGWNPGAIEPGTHNGGLWGFTASPVSLAELKAFADSKGTPWTRIKTQVEFLLKNLNIHDSGYRNRLNGMNVTEATESFMRDWERPASMSSLGKRTEAAKKALGFIGNMVTGKRKKGGGGGARFDPKTGGMQAPASAAKGPNTGPLRLAPGGGVVPNILQGIGMEQVERIFRMPGLNPWKASELALDAAGRTPQSWDERQVMKFQLNMGKGRKVAVQKQIAQINKQLRGRLTDKQRSRLLAKRDNLLGQVGTWNERIDTAREGLRGDSSETGEDPLLAAMEADKEAREAHTQAIKENTEQMKRQSDLAESAIATGSATAWKALSDILSGQLGGSAQQSAALAGAGNIGSIGRF